MIQYREEKASQWQYKILGVNPEGELFKLKNHTRYLVCVAGKTKVGVGVFSAPVQAVTDENGKRKFFFKENVYSVDQGYSN